MARTYGAGYDAARVVELLTSEVVTNAVKYGEATGTIDVDVQCADGAVTVSVADDNPTAPTVQHRPAHLTGGRGMQLVERLSTAWGTRRHGAGKRVWFTVALP